MSNRRNGHTLIELFAILSLLTGLAFSGVRCFSMLQSINARRVINRNARHDIGRFAASFRADADRVAPELKIESSDWPIEIPHTKGKVIYGFDGATHGISRRWKSDTSESQSTERYQLRPGASAMISSSDGWLTVTINAEPSPHGRSDVAHKTERFVIEVQK